MQIYLRTKDHLKEKGIKNIVGFIFTIIRTVSFCCVSVCVQTLYINKKYTYIYICQQQFHGVQYT